MDISHFTKKTLHPGMNEGVYNDTCSQDWRHKYRIQILNTKAPATTAYCKSYLKDISLPGLLLRMLCKARNVAMKLANEST